MWMRTGMRCAKRTQVKMGLTVATPWGDDRADRRLRAQPRDLDGRAHRKTAQPVFSRVGRQSGFLGAEGKTAFARSSAACMFTLRERRRRLEAS